METEKDEEGCKTVVTGQQIGLLGGPLYTTYKVLGAVFLAKELNGKAVYWLETNDADFNEINHIDFLDNNGELNTLSWDLNTEGFSCGLIECDESLRNLLESFFASLRQTEFTPGLRELALDCYQPGRMLGDASVLLAKELFKGFDLEFFNPMAPEFREFSKKILLKEAQHTPDGSQCNLFCMIGNQRKAVFNQGGLFRLRDDTVVNLEEYNLVPNVKTRNICQDAFFNTHTYVAGPGEIKYIAELDDGYGFHGVKKAAVQPRMSISLMEPRVLRLLEKTGLTLKAVMDTTREDLVKQVLKDRSETNFDARQSTQDSMEMTEHYLDRLQGLGVEPTDIKHLRKLLRPEVKKAIGNLRAKEKEKHQRLIKDTEFLSDNLKPFNKPQERVFNIFYYMNLYGGRDFIGHLYEHYDWQRRELMVGDFAK